MPNDLQPLPPEDQKPLSRLPANRPALRSVAKEGDLGPLTSDLSYFGPPPDPIVQARRYLAFLARKWWIVALSVLFFGALAAAYFVWWPASYATKGHLWAAGQMGLHLDQGTTYTEDITTYAGTQVELLQSDFIQGRAYVSVTNTLHLAFPTNSEGKPKIPKIKVAQLPKSTVLELVAKGSSAELTKAFLNAIMDEFIAYKKEIRAANSGDSYASVSEQIKKQEVDLTAAQDKLTEYMRANNVAVLEERAKAASVYLTQLLAEYSQLKAQLQLIQSLKAQGPIAFASATNLLAGLAGPRRLGTSLDPVGGASPDFLTAQQELEKLQILRTRLSQYFRPDHPKMIKLDEQITEGEQLVDFLNHQTRDQLESAEETATTKVDGLQASIKDWETKIRDASERIAECERLEFNVKQLQDLHDHLLSLLQTVDVSKSLDQDNITVLDQPSEAKDARRVPLMAVFLILVGFGVGFGLVALLQRSDDHIRSLEELNERLDAQVIAMIPDVRASRANPGVRG